MKYATLACSCTRKLKSNSIKVFKLYPVIKNNYEAQICACIHSDKKWLICSVFFNHNYELNCPTKIKCIKRNRIILPFVKKKLEANDMVGIRPNKDFNSFLA